ncbi:unnamed protein product [Paramecium sonneborni]|uniref:RING-type domain-containing protein n=1 Tax=Paramecium sonneborni TaxID=65129 RepID=A0A8S1QR75_9CILI|nr:unnamed protein product [Paramecium sonneborni]
MQGFYNQVKSLMQTNLEEPNYDDNYKCFCGQQIRCDPFDDLYNHISHCKKFLSESLFYKEFEKLRLNIFKLPQLYTLKAEFLYIINQIDEIINKKENSQLNSPKNSNRQQKQQLPQQSNQIQKQCFNNIHKKFFPLNSREQVIRQKCSACGKIDNNEDEMEMVYNFKICQHAHCLGCIRKLINQQYIQKSGCVQCQYCQKQLSQQEIEKYVGTERLQYLQKKIRTGESPAQQKQQCSFCYRYLNNQDIKPGQRAVCKQQECQAKNTQACQKLANCKHFCNGYKDEKNCLGCLGCTNQNQSEEYCTICFTESLYEGPCIQAACGHIFHYYCLNKKLEKKWTTMYISFGFCCCSICKRWMEFPKDSISQLKMNQYEELQQLVRKQASLRMGKMGDNQILKVEDALEIFAFYQCDKCKKPYFGGKKDCQLELEAEQNRQNLSDLICPSCCGQQINGCKTHGTEFLEYKCRYCCNIATYFCWGTTHFCQICHTKQSGGKYLTQLKKEELPQCQGKGKCPIGGNHLPNGQEQCLGCGLCNNQ